MIVLQKVLIQCQMPEVYSESSQTSKMGLFANVVNCRKPLNIFAKGSILDVYWVLNTPVNAKT